MEPGLEPRQSGARACAFNLPVMPGFNMLCNKLFLFWSPTCLGRAGSVGTTWDLVGLDHPVAKEADSLVGDISVPCKCYNLRLYFQSSGPCGPSPGVCAT